ncbi:MAG TPA: hypothetical protein VIK11_09500 [Tepidiformaceae bacterium]
MALASFGEAAVVADTVRRVDARDERAVPSLADAVQTPLLRLIEEYTSAMETMRRVLAALGPLASLAEAAASPAPPATPVPLQGQPSASLAVGVEVGGANRQALIDFEDALGQVTGVERVALRDLSDGRASFTVTLSTPRDTGDDGPGFSVVCAWCGRLLTLGGVRVSHGLCPDCAAAAAAGHAAQDLAERAVNVRRDDKMLLFLRRTARGWVARRSDGAGGWIDFKTGCPADTPAHRVLEQVSAEYPNMMVVVTGDGGAKSSPRARVQSAIG